MAMILPLLVFGLALTSSLARWPRTLFVLVYTSYASSVNAVDPGSIIPISHAKGLHWSKEPLVLKQKGGEIVFHNYTVYSDNDGQQRTRWLNRQFLPDANERTGLQRRGLYRWKDPNRARDGVWWSDEFLWSATSQRGQYRFTVVSYCFEDIDSKVMLKSIVEKAADRWHTALGPRTGVRFMENCEAMCGPLGSLTPHGKAVLRIRADRLVAAHAPLGCASRSRDTNILRMDPGSGTFRGTSDKDQDWFTTVSGMVHELGHVLGLYHEHSRPRAAQEINVHCDRIDGYAETKAILQKDHPDADVDQICEDWDIAAQFDSVMPVISFIPIPDIRTHGTESEGPLDRKSVMLYSSANRGNVLFWKDPNDETKEHPIFVNHFPSAGDVAAVKVMYPDYIPLAGYHWDGDQVVEDESQAISSHNNPPAVPPKPSSLQASKARPPVSAKPTSLRVTSSTTKPLSQVVHDAFATTGQSSSTDMATFLDIIEN